MEGLTDDESAIVEVVHDMQWWRKMRWSVSREEYRARKQRALRRARARQPVCHQRAETVAKEHMRANKV